MFTLIKSFEIRKMLERYKQLLYDSEEKNFKIDFEAMILNLIAIAEV